MGKGAPGKSLVSWWPRCAILLGKSFPKILIDQNNGLCQPGSAGMTLPPPEGSAGMQEMVGKDQDGSGTETPVPQTLSRHRRALGGRRT